MRFFGAFRYAVQVWLTAVFGAPIIFFVVTAIGSIFQIGSFREMLFGGELILPIGLMMLAGGLLSLPSGLFFWRIAHIVCKSDAAVRSKRWTLFAVGTMITLLTFLLLGDFNKLLEALASYVFFFYWVPLSFAVFYYRLPVVLEESDKKNEEF